MRIEDKDVELNHSPRFPANENFQKFHLFIPLRLDDYLSRGAESIPGDIVCVFMLIES